MKKLLLSACAGLMALTTPMATPAFAQSFDVQIRTQPNVQQVQFREGSRWDRDGRRWDRDNRRWDRDDRRYGWHNGHRGYREYRRGYRQHNGFWFPPAAFIAGAIIGGAIANQPTAPRVVRPAGNAHVQWCYNRYKSYRASDNTFQPYNGPRKPCYSPYS